MADGAISAAALRQLDAAPAVGVVRGQLFAHVAVTNGRDEVEQLILTDPRMITAPWLGELIWWADWGGTAARWHELVLCRLVRALRLIASATPETMRRLDYRCRAVALRGAPLRSSAMERVAVESVLVLLDRLGRGDNAVDWLGTRDLPRAARAATSARHGDDKGVSWTARGAVEEAEEAGDVGESVGDRIIVAICTELERTAAQRLCDEALP